MTTPKRQVNIIKWEDVEEGCESMKCMTCGFTDCIYKFADTINGEYVLTDECKGCYVDEE